MTPPVAPRDATLPVGELRLELFLARFQTLDLWQHDNLTAPYWRLYLVDRSGGVVRQGNRELPLRPGIATVIPANTAFATRQNARFTQLYVHFSPVSASGIVELPEILQHSLSPAQQALFAQLQNDPTEKTPPWQQTLRVTRLILEILETAPLRIRRRFSPDKRIALAQQTLEQVAADPATPHPANQDLARLVHMNRNAFIRLFRQETGLTPQRYLTRLRINHACHLLHHTDLSIEEIAARCGFCDRYHFSRVFKTHRDLGPATFRHQIEPHRPVESHAAV